MALKDQHPQAFTDWLTAAGGIDKVASDAFDAWCYATGTVPADKAGQSFMARRAMDAGNECLQAIIQAKV